MRYVVALCLALALIGVNSTTTFAQTQARGFVVLPTTKPAADSEGLSLLAAEMMSPTGHRYALCIGIDNYNPDSGYPTLHCAVADAKSLGAVFEALGYETTVMTDDGYGIHNSGMLNRGLVPTSANITRELQEFAYQAKNPNDDLVISYAGHGVLVGKEAAIVPMDYSRDLNNLVTVSKILDPLNDPQCLARNKLLLLDACHSGAGTDKFFQDFTREKSLMVFSACSAQQSSIEDVDKGHGRFTEALITGLVGKKFAPSATQPAGNDAIAQWNGEAYVGGSEFLSAHELSAYVGKIFKDRGWAANKNAVGQNPQMFGEQDVTIPMIVARRKVSTPIPLSDEDKKTIDETLAKANAAYVARNWVKMIHHATTVLRIQDGNADALALRALGNLHATYVDQADDDARNALAADPDQAIALQVRGMCAAGSHDKSLARGYLRAAGQLVNANQAKWPLLASGEEAAYRTLATGIVTDDAKESADCLRVAAASPDLSPELSSNVSLVLGRKYEKGDGIPQDYKKALDCYLKSADEGNSTAMLAAGQLYEDGHDGVPRNYPEALKWYKKAADAGNAAAYTHIGHLCEYGNHDYKQAVENYTLAAKAGQGEAMHNIASLYEQGHVPSPDNKQALRKDYKQARSWYEQAADVGDAASMNRMGYLCENGLGILQDDYAQAMEWYLKAAAEGNSEAMNNIGALYYHGRGCSKDYMQAMTWYRKAADHGSRDAMSAIGYLFEHGEGVARDYSQAMVWYRKAADAGDAAAMNNIGSLFDHHLGVPQDYNLAMFWYHKAADLNYAEAMGNIGYLYDNGHGVTQDYAQAKDWYFRAANAGDPAAMNNLGSLYQTGNGVTRDDSQAMTWFHKAAAAGNPEAMNNIGNAYLNGTGVQQDPAQAITWYHQAASAGFAKSMLKLAVLYESGQQGVPKDPDQARTWYAKAAERDDEDAKKWLAAHGGK